MTSMKTLSFFLSLDEGLEFEPMMPEQFFVRAMHSDRGIFITEDFLKSVNQYDVAGLCDSIMADLSRHREGDTEDILKWYYLLMDFKEDFPRLVLLKALRESGH